MVDEGWMNGFHARGSPNAGGNPFDVPVLITEGSDLGDGPLTAAQSSRYMRAGVKVPFLAAGAMRMGHRRQASCYTTMIGVNVFTCSIGSVSTTGPCWIHACAANGSIFTPNTHWG